VWQAPWALLVLLARKVPLVQQVRKGPQVQQARRDLLVRQVRWVRLARRDLEVRRESPVLDSTRFRSACCVGPKP